MRKWILSLILLPELLFPQPDLDLNSDYVYLMDADSGQELFSRNAEERMYPASMTKVMTAVVVLENTDSLWETVPVTDEMWTGLIEANASTAGFLPGTEPTVMDLLYGVLLPSGADAVNALCIHTAGSAGAFVELMNTKAAELGMYSTHYTNPTGLHDPDHWSTAKDTAVLFCYALQNPVFAEIINTSEYTASTGLVMKSTVNAHAAYIDGFQGGKTGYTIPAGVCLASHAYINGMHLVLVSAHSPYAGGNVVDADTVYSWLRNNIEKRILLRKGEVLARISFQDSRDEDSMTIIADQDVVLDLPYGADIRFQEEKTDVLQTPVQEGTVLYHCTITVNGQTVYEQSDLLDHEIRRSLPRWLYRTGREALQRYRFVLLALVIALILLRRRRS